MGAVRSGRPNGREMTAPGAGKHPCTAWRPHGPARQRPMSEEYRRGRLQRLHRDRLAEIPRAHCTVYNDQGFTGQNRRDDQRWLQPQSLAVWTQAPPTSGPGRAKTVGSCDKAGHRTGPASTGGGVLQYFEDATIFKDDSTQARTERSGKPVYRTSGCARACAWKRIVGSPGAAGTRQRRRRTASDSLRWKPYDSLRWKPSDSLRRKAYCHC